MDSKATSPISVQGRAAVAARPLPALYRPRPGLSIPCITVLDREGRIAEVEQRRVFWHQVQGGHGADILFVGGTNGEWNRLKNEQRQRLVELAADEVRRINAGLTTDGRAPVEAWAGITAPTRKETLDNLVCALDAEVHAAVLAPLSIQDVEDVVEFFHRDVSDLMDRRARYIPVFLYDNADITAHPEVPHIRTRDMKRISRLPYIFGIKVSAPRRVLGHYTKAALHFKDKGEFGIYIGNAMLIFDVFRLGGGWLGRTREYWNRYLLHNDLPIGVVSGPSNVLPREWQRAWRSCYVGDEERMKTYRSLFLEFGSSYRFEEDGRQVKKTIACLKHALRLDGVIEHDEVARGTKELTPSQRGLFRDRYEKLKARIRAETDPLWVTRTP